MRWGVVGGRQGERKGHQRGGESAVAANQTKKEATMALEGEGRAK